MPRDETSKRTRLARPVSGPGVTWDDSRLVRACLKGNEEAWSALIDKYRNLIYSIPLKYGATPQDAEDVLQAVSLELFSELPRLRKTASLRSWLITVAAHASFRWKRTYRRRAEEELPDLEQRQLEADPQPDLVEQVEREQMVREAVAQLPSRCQEMIRLLFFEQPPVPYSDLARRLGLARGSIGFIRGRCLRRLQRALEKSGL